VVVDEITPQLESSKGNTNSDGEESLAIRPLDHNETELDNEDIDTSTTPRPKTPSRYVQKEHPESQILGDQRFGVLTRRNFFCISSCENLALLSQVEPKNIN